MFFQMFLLFYFFDFTNTLDLTFLTTTLKNKNNNNNCGVIEPKDLHPHFALDLGPMPRPIIAYKEDNGDHGNPRSCAENNHVLG